jgi:DNA replication protein DnaC
MRQGIKDAETDVNRQKTFTGTKYAELTFERDDSLNSYISQSLRKYSSSYKNKGDKWLLIYGGRGVGKTFYAACVANRLISNGHSVLFKTAAEIEDKVLSAKDKEQAYEDLKSHDVLVIDNLFAVDRRTDFAFKVMNRVVEDIYKSGKTLIVTATMTDAETGDPPDERMKTVMAYIWEKGLPFKVTGKDRRVSWNAGNNNKG